MKEAEADVALNKASAESAQINQTYTKILSPISGRIGRSSVTEGALVTNGQTTAWQPSSNSTRLDFLLAPIHDIDFEGRYRIALLLGD